MKKTILSLLFAGTTLIGFSQEKVNGVEIKTEHLEPITYSSVEEKESMCPARIAHIKSEMAKPGITEEQKKSLAELLWRFENAVVRTND